MITEEKLMLNVPHPQIWEELFGARFNDIKKVSIAKKKTQESLKQGLL